MILKVIIGLVVIALAVGILYSLIIIDEKYPKLKLLLIYVGLGCSVAWLIGLVAYGIGEAILNPEDVRKELDELLYLLS